MANFTLNLSDEAAELKRSAIRDLLGLAVNPEIISLAGGLPANEHMPIDQFRECMNLVLERDGARAMQYSPQYDPLREWIAGNMLSQGVPCEIEQICITNGAQQGLAILSRVFLNPGEPAVTEEVTFTGIQQVTRGRGATVYTIPTDLDDGADMDALETAFRRDPKPRLAVLIPDFHNPLGVSLSAEKRMRAAALAAEHGVPLVEDDPYSALRFEGEPTSLVKAYDDAGVVFYLGSFSKILAPAVRLGWIVASQEFIPKITAIRESLDLETSTLMQRTVSEFLERGYLDPHLAKLTSANLERFHAIDQALETHLGDIATWTRPQGGLFTWVTLPEQIDTWEMFDSALERKVAYIPGSAFAVQGGYANTMRLNFSSATPEQIKEAIPRLSEVIRERVG
jgi:2-aminoadipate transaminase